MTKTLSKRQAEERQIALLWFFIHSKGMAEEFIEFCRTRNNLSLAQIERQLRTTITNQTK